MADFKHKLKQRYPRLFHRLHLDRMKRYAIIGRISPKTLIGIWYKNSYHKPINLKNPVDIDEKINWMKLHCNMELWTLCADKYSVRGYVAEKGLCHTLNELYAVCDNAEELKFEQFPAKYVIKSTNGGGGKNVLIVDGSFDIDRKAAIRKLNGWLKEKPSDLYVEPHYRPIVPRLIVEKYIEPNPWDASLVDIKINCINGKAFSVLLCSDRIQGGRVCLSVYDLDWVLQPDKILPEFRTGKIYPRPVSFQKMIEYSERLASGIPFVRVDWYEVDGKPVFSEMTFTPAGGFQCYYSMDFLLQMGNMLILPSPNH